MIHKRFRSSEANDEAEENDEAETSDEDNIEAEINTDSSGVYNVGRVWLKSKDPRAAGREFRKVVKWDKWFGRGNNSKEFIDNPTGFMGAVITRTPKFTEGYAYFLFIEQVTDRFYKVRISTKEVISKTKLDSPDGFKEILIR